MTPASFEKAFEFTFKWERGPYEVQPNDPGRGTKNGITQESYDLYRVSRGLPSQSVANMSDVEMMDIYKKNIWNLSNSDKLGLALGVVHFDTCVNTGTTQANKFLQTCVGATPDGSVGPVTLKAILATPDLGSLVTQYLALRSGFYHAIIKQHADAIQAAIAEYKVTPDKYGNVVTPDGKTLYNLEPNRVGWDRRVSDLTLYVSGLGS